MKLKFLAADIFDLMGMSNLPDDQKIAMLTKMNAIVGQRIMFRVMDQLSEADNEALDKLIQAEAGQDEINNFLKGKVDLEMIITEEITQFKQQLSQDFNAIIQSAKQ